MEGRVVENRLRGTKAVDVAKNSSQLPQILVNASRVDGVVSVELIRKAAVIPESAWDSLPAR